MARIVKNWRRMSLHQVLAAVGWTSEESEAIGRRIVRNETGEIVGRLTADETWHALRRLGHVGRLSHEGDGRYCWLCEQGKEAA